MSNTSLKFLIIIGILILCVLPVMTVFSMIDFGNDAEENIKLEKDEFNIKDYVIGNNKDAKIFIGDINYSDTSEDILDQDVPLGLNEKEANDKDKKSEVKPKVVKGETVKNDFKSHADQIKNGKLVFELITKDGKNVLFTLYDELAILIKDKADYEKYFLLDENSNLIRYTYLEK